MILLVFLAACSVPEEHEPQREDVDFEEYKFIRKSTEEECISGNCPDLDFLYRPEMRECGFCDEMYVSGDKLIVDTEGEKSVTSRSGCKLESQGPIIDELHITKRNETSIRALGETVNEYKRCDAHYKIKTTAVFVFK